MYNERSCIFYFCCENTTPGGRDVQDGLNDRMVYQKHVDGFFIFLYVVFGPIWKNFASLQHILWPSSYAYWANFYFSSSERQNFVTNAMHQ
jgi:hypothetical protein